MKSMTGFGAASRSRSGLAAAVEVRSVNNRFLKVSVRVPSALSSREHEIDALVREYVTRGTVNLVVRLDLRERPVKVRMNEEAVQAYRKLLARLGRRADLPDAPTLDLLARLPGVFEAEEIDAVLPDSDWELVRAVIVTALRRLAAMRRREGSNLRKDLAGRRARIARLVGRLGKRAPRVVAENRDRLRERVKALLGGGGEIRVAEEDLAREVAILAERSDVTEEITRLSSHLDQLGEALRAEEEVGRRLDFLAQEMLREANTISAKSADVEMSRLCVDLKVELDRLKEQVQNVE